MNGKIQQEQVPFESPKKKHDSKSLSQPVIKQKSAPSLVSPWAKLATFCNESYLNFIPQGKRNQNYQTYEAPIHQKCVELLTQSSFDSWEDIVRQFAPNEQKDANDFYFRLSNRYKESPQIICQRLKSNLHLFCELIEYALIDSENRDLVKINDFVDVMNSFGYTSEQTFLFLSQLPSALNNDVRSILDASIGYKTILKWGASPLLRKFWLQLQRKFRLTRTAIKEEAVQNLARELGETETLLRNQIQQLITENEELKEFLESISLEASQKAIYNLATILQSQAQPVLDQIFTLYHKLVKMSESEDKLLVTAEEALSILITLESLLQAFQNLNITYFPKDTSKSFKLDSNQLGEYLYVEGSAFCDAKDKKVVRCVSPGWRVGKEVITPARVKEITE